MVLLSFVRSTSTRSEPCIGSAAASGGVSSADCACDVAGSDIEASIRSPDSVFFSLPQAAREPNIRSIHSTQSSFFIFSHLPSPCLLDATVQKRRSERQRWSSQPAYRPEPTPKCQPAHTKPKAPPRRL